MENTPTGFYNPTAEPPLPKRGTALAIIAFVLSDIALFILGPGMLLAMMMSSPFSWVISYIYVYFVVAAAIISLIALPLYLVGLSRLMQNRPDKIPRTLVMLISSLFGYALMWAVAFFQIIPMRIIIYIILITACIVVPWIILIIMHFKKTPFLIGISPRLLGVIKVCTWVAYVEIIVAIIGLCRVFL